MIKKLGPEHLDQTLSIIHRSFQSVAQDLDLSIENCPTHPSYLPREKLEIEMNQKDFFGYFLDQSHVAVIAIERSTSELFFIERVAVLPSQRHRSIGSQMMNYAIQEISKRGGKKISIAIINEDSILKQWYQSFGFVQSSIKNFNHLPFQVCFLEYLY